MNSRRASTRISISLSGRPQGVVERKTTIPVLSHILLQARDEKLRIAATDLDVSLTSWVQGDVEEEGGIAVQARKFLETSPVPGAEPRMVVRSNKDELLRVAKANGVVGVLVDYDPQTRAYSAASALY